MPSVLMKRERPLLTGWKFYIFGTPIIFLFMFIVLTLSTRFRRFSTEGPRVVFSVIAVVAAIATAWVVISGWLDERRK
jgi:hypothetical protein